MPTKKELLEELHKLRLQGIKIPYYSIDTDFFTIQNEYFIQTQKYEQKKINEIITELTKSLVYLSKLS